MAVSKRILGIAAVSALFAAAAPGANAASTIQFKGGSAGVDFGAANTPTGLIVAAAKCPGALPGTCVGTPGTGIFAGYNAFEASGTNSLFVAFQPGNTTSTDGPNFIKDVSFFVGDFNVIAFGGGATPAISVKSKVPPFTPGGTGEVTFAGVDPTTGENIFIRNFKGVAVPVEVSSSTFGTRSGSITINSLAGAFTTSTGGETWTHEWYSDISLTVDDPSSQVPAPLPILGAGAAFGFSRKLRKRIKATAS